MTRARVLVLGATGMLGHALAAGLAPAFDVTATIRGTPDAAVPAIAGLRTLTGVELLAPGAVETVLRERYDVVVNAVGMIKQRPDAEDAVAQIALNALLPHRLAAACRDQGARLIHFSTDCVFSGAAGGVRGPDGYREEDPADATDLYGRSKLLGEVAGPGCLTLRVSLIGRERRAFHGLIEWFLRQPRNAQLRGFTRAMFTGITTGVATDVVAMLIRDHPALSGLRHVAATPISKHALLEMLRLRSGIAVTLAADPEFFCDRRLDGSRFAAETGWCAPPWDTMVAALAGAEPQETGALRRD